MPHSIMSIQEVAGLLGMDQRRAERMAQRGQIPCQKVGGQLRFNRAEITEWLQQHMIYYHRFHMDPDHIIPDESPLTIRTYEIIPFLPSFGVAS